VTDPRFLADAMLGRLARWLRVLGFDTEYDSRAPDDALVRRAADEGRIILTRDRHLLRERRPAGAIEIHGDVPLEQLRQVVDALALDAPRELFTRCLIDNALLELVPEPERDALLPPAARATRDVVRRCGVCGRVYWRGSHARRMQVALARALPHWWPP
jgi:uncharacterized protein with PIN domain